MLHIGYTYTFIGFVADKSPLSTHDNTIMPDSFASQFAHVRPSLEHDCVKLSCLKINKFWVIAVMKVCRKFINKWQFSEKVQYKDKVTRDH